MAEAVALLAIATGNAILAWLVIAVALAGAAVAVPLLTRVVRPALEIKRYAEEISEAGNSIASNVEGAADLERTRELAATMPGLIDRRLGSR